METHRSAETLAFLDNDVVSLGDSSIATQEDYLSASEVLQTPARNADDLAKENAELRRHVKRRTQALDAMRKSYISDVASLKHRIREQAAEPAALELIEPTLEGIPSLDFRPVLSLYAPRGTKLTISPCGECGGTMEIIHKNDKEEAKLRSQNSSLKEQLEDTGRQLGYSNALAETHRSREEALALAHEQDKGAMLKEIVSLKEKIGSAGPEVLAKVLEGKEQAEWRLRSSERRVAELEGDLHQQREYTGRLEGELVKLEEMGYHLQKKSREVDVLAAARDEQAADANELREKVKAMHASAREAADVYANIRKALREQQESERQTTNKLRTLLNATKAAELALREEVASLREECLAAASRTDDDEDIVGGDQRGSSMRRSRSRPYAPQPNVQGRSPSSRVDGEGRVGVPPRGDARHAGDIAEKSCRLEEELESFRRILGMQRDHMSQAIGRTLDDWQRAAKEMSTKVHALDDPGTIINVWKSVRVGLEEAQTAVSEWGEVKELHAIDSHAFRSGAARRVEIYQAPAHEPREGAEACRANVGDISTTEGIAEEIFNVSDDEAAGPLLKIVSLLEEDHRQRQTDTKVLQLHAMLRSKALHLQERIAESEIDLVREQEAMKALENKLEEQRELLSVASASAEERAKASNNASDAAASLRAQLQTQKEEKAKLAIELEEGLAMKKNLEAGLTATKAALDASVDARRQVERKAEGNAILAEQNEHQAQRNARRAEAEGMRAEESLSRRYLSDASWTRKMAVAVVELTTCRNEIARRRREAEEHAEQMQDFRALVLEHSRLDEELTRKNAHISDLEQKVINDQAIIDELKLEVVLLDTMRREVLKLEHGKACSDAELKKANASLDIARQRQKESDKDARRKSSLVRSLWRGLTAVVLLLDDWFLERTWTDRKDTGKEANAGSGARHFRPPPEAGSVEDVLKLRRQDIEGGDSNTARTATPLPDVSTRERLESLPERDVKAWIEHQAHAIATMHRERVEELRYEMALLEAATKERAAESLLQEEAMRQIEVEREALEKTCAELLATKENLTETVQRQNEVLVDNARDLQECAKLQIDHQAEIEHHCATIRRLGVEEENVKVLLSRLETAAEAKMLAESTARDAAVARSSALEERDAAKREAFLARTHAERAQAEKVSVDKRLQDVVQAHEDRLATNKAVATEIAHGDFTADGPTQTDFLSPELTLRHMKRSRTSSTPPDSMGRVFPALKRSNNCAIATNTVARGRTQRDWSHTEGWPWSASRKGEGVGLLKHTSQVQEMYEELDHLDPASRATATPHTEYLPLARDRRLPRTPMGDVVNRWTPLKTTWSRQKSEYLSAHRLVRQGPKHSPENVREERRLRQEDNTTWLATWHEWGKD